MSTRWCCRLLQNEFGPMEFDELLELAMSETLGGGDLVRRETEDVWTAASKCPELRRAFAKDTRLEEARPAQNDPTIPAGTEIRSRDRATEQTRPSERHTSNQSSVASKATVPMSPRQLWVAWLLTLTLMLVLFFVDRLIDSAAPTFPQPRRVREQLAGLHWFVGTGPWSQWESLLLWLDSLVILSCASTWLTRRLTR